MRNRAGVILVATALVACAGSGEFDYVNGIGLVFTDAYGVSCLRSAGIWQPGDSLTLIGTHEGQPMATAVIGASIEQCVESRLIDDLPARHAIATEGLANGMWFAVLHGPVAQQGRIDLDGDGEPETFRMCNSMEGLHPSVWTGTPGAGTRRWHRYIYLGYDMDPTCTDADFPEIKTSN